ncbi:MAG: serine hydrolase domain-containing protein [Chitinophagaceae bacterium]
MKRSYLLIGVLLLGCLSCKKKGHAQQDACNNAAFQSETNHSFYAGQLKQYQTINALPGAILGIASPQQLWINASGLANRESKQPIAPCTPFRVGSITKMFTAALIMQLQEQGALSLDSRISQLLPALDGRIPAAGQITVRMLLNHSSGITDPKNDDTQYLADIKADPMAIGQLSIDQKLSRYVFDRPLHFAPGSAARYSNTGYWLLGKIAEQLSGKSMQQLLQEKIFIPLGMQHSYYEKRANDSLAQGYHELEGHLLNVTVYDQADGDADPSSGIISTAADLVRFAKGFFGARLFSAAALKQMKEILHLPSCADGDCGYTLGFESWQVGAHTGWGMNGSSIGYETNLVYFPDKEIIFISFGNKGGGSHKAFIEAILSQAH